MGELGSIFGDRSSEGARGRDLHVEVSVPRDALGRTGGYRVHVPHVIEQGDERLARVLDHDDDETVTLHLPAEFGSGSVLRLRGQGGVLKDGHAGDLYLKVIVAPAPAPALAWWFVAAGTGGAFVGGLAWWLLALLQ